MCKIIPVPYRVFIKKLKKLGLEGPHQGRKHPYMVIGDTVIVLPNPHQGEDVDVKLIKAILKEAGISREEWLSI
ncbi:MAG TPA: type II toxin-antitoxin system HicA family toxin [Methanothrix sp.]|nr:type II toxin-antitoxin system HicA family toxin [Methanothrix sp.]